MIYIEDDFLPNNTYKELLTRLVDNKFIEVKAGDKSFWVQDAIQEVDDLIKSKLSSLENKPIRNILSFVRISNDKVDTDWRIHADTIIKNEKPDRALVLYLSESSVNHLHGTAFWEHKELGDSMSCDISNEEYDRILLEDSNNLDKWDLRSVIGYKPNRLISYPCNYFHSKYPNKSWEDGRIVYVMFYKNE